MYGRSPWSIGFGALVVVEPPGAGPAGERDDALATSWDDGEAAATADVLRAAGEGGWPCAQAPVKVRPTTAKRVERRPCIARPTVEQGRATLLDTATAVEHRRLSPGL